MWMLTHAPGIKDMPWPASASPTSTCSRSWPPSASRVALFLGFAAGFVPALGAYRSRITDMLRTV